MASDLNRGKRRKLIDRDREQREFQTLLTFQDNVRIFTIQDQQGGMGKSLLLETLRMHCLEQDIPVCLVKFEEDFEYKSPFLFVQHIAQELKLFDLEFPQFDKMEVARKVGDLNSIYRFTSVEGTVHLEGATFDNATNPKITGTEFHIEQQIINIGSVELRPEHERDAQEKSIEAFFDDLRFICSTRPIILMIDTYEKCRLLSEVDDNWQKLETWLLRRLVKLLFDLQKRPNKLLLVLAGREVPDSNDVMVPSARYSEVVKTIDEMSQWDREHVIEYLDFIGFEYESRHVDTFYSMIEFEVPLLDVFRAIDLAQKAQTRKKKL